jgi:MFS family permease
VIVWACAGFGIGLIGFALSRMVWLSLLLMLMTGFAMMVQMASCNTILQTIADDDKRGRVMSFYSMAFMGMAPFGSLLAGTLARHWGVPTTIVLGGVCCILGSLHFARKLPALRVLIRPIYMQKGILPQVASSIQMVTEDGEAV